MDLDLAKTEMLLGTGLRTIGPEMVLEATGIQVGSQRSCQRPCEILPNTYPMCEH